MSKHKRHKHHKRKRKRRPDADDCCCLVDEVFDGPCFVATAAHGDASAEPVRVLRRYRDQRLSRNRAGRAFTVAYYRYGRYGARVLRRYPALKPAVRVALAPIVAYARKRVR